jgi:hypothetical protein
MPQEDRGAMTMGTDTGAMLEQIKANAQRAGVFGPCRMESRRLVCPAAASAEPADYRVWAVPGGSVWVELVTANRWLSGSIETDLVHTGDKLNELLDEELAELGWAGGPATFEHFRSEELLFTFRSRVPDPTPESVTIWLLAYEQCFRQLGDMDNAGADD